MVRKVLLSASAILVMSGVAMSADMGMPVKAVAPAYLYDWSGIYIGGVIGGAWGTHDLSDPGLGIVGTILGVPVTQTNNASGSSAASKSARVISSASWSSAGKAT